MTDPSKNLGLLLQIWTEKLKAAGIDSAALDARLLAAKILGCSRADLLSRANDPLPSEQQDGILALIERRAAREPVGRILGEREFWGLPFRLNEATLEPRPDSESLIEAAETLPLPTAPRFLDLGTGTGCLLLALLHVFPSATGVGLDLSPRAIEAAKDNAENLGLADRARFINAGWTETGWTDPALFADAPRFDLIISNPPYIESKVLQELEPEVRLHDPALALDGGPDGLDPYKILIPRFPTMLTGAGWAIVEIGFNQAEAVKTLFQKAGFTSISIQKDLGSNPRCVVGRR